MKDDLNGPSPKPTWYRRRALLVGVVVAALLAVTIITDLPVHSSRSSDISNEQSVLSELNSDLAPCVLAVRESLTIWTSQMAHTLSASDRTESASLLRDDQNACSFTNESMYDLSNIEVPGSTAGKDMGDLVATSVLWTTSDALRTIEAVQALMLNGHDSTAQESLMRGERELAADRAAGLAEFARADRILETHLTRPDLPELPMVPAT